MKHVVVTPLNHLSPIRKLIPGAKSSFFPLHPQLTLCTLWCPGAVLKAFQGFTTASNSQLTFPRASCCSRFLPRFVESPRPQKGRCLPNPCHLHLIDVIRLGEKHSLAGSVSLTQLGAAAEEPGACG